MQDVTDLPFMKVLHRYGSPDYYFTEYFRVYPHSIVDKHILRSITENPTGRPVVAQLLGNSLEDMRRIASKLETYPVAGIDLNVGCPAPKIYRSVAGGGLLRDLPRLDTILGTLRDAVNGHFSVKIRLGFDSFEPFAGAMELVRKHGVDLLTIHARTVAESYRGEPHYEFIREAVGMLSIPVLANGNITSPAKASQVIRETGAAGLMIGRSAIRNPWIFQQIREASLGQPVFQPTLADAYRYIEDLHQMCREKIAVERPAIHHLKKFINFVGQSVDPQGRFIKAMRRCQSDEAFFEVCREHLLSEDRAAQLFAIEPYAGVVARPNCEDGYQSGQEGCSL
jgi:tRNA-dihydrouridine synthase B